MLALVILINHVLHPKPPPPVTLTPKINLPSFQIPMGPAGHFTLPLLPYDAMSPH